MNIIHPIVELLSERPGGAALDLLPGVVTWSFRLGLIIAAGLLSVAALGRCSATLRGRLLLIAMFVAMLLPLVGRGLPALRVLSPPQAVAEVANTVGTNGAEAPGCGPWCIAGRTFKHMWLIWPRRFGNRHDAVAEQPLCIYGRAHASSRLRIGSGRCSDIFDGPDNAVIGASATRAAIH